MPLPPAYRIGGIRVSRRVDGSAEVTAIYVDADACPVKPEIYRVATRHALRVVLVSNAWMRVPLDDRVSLVVVNGDFDAADDWIVEHVTASDIVISGDIPLAARCLAKGAAALDMRGGVFTEDNIGEALASRQLLSELRDSGAITGGPAAHGKRDRSRFLQRLEDTVQAIRRRT